MSQKAAKAQTQSVSPFAFLLYMVCGLPLMVVALHLRSTVLSGNGGGYEMVAEFLGLSGVNALSFGKRLALFREDLLLLFILTPLVLFAIIRPLRPIQRGMFAGISCFLIAAILYIELKCFWEVGTFLPLRVLWGGLTEVGRGFLPDYVDRSALLAICFFLILGVVLTFCVAVIDARGKLQACYEKTRVFVLPLAALALLVTALSWLIPFTKTPFSFSSTAQALSGFFFGEETSAPVPLSGSAIENYRKLTQAPLGERSEYFGRAADYDVIFFGLETAPAACFQPLTSEDFPHLAKLKESAFVAEGHYSTYPYTSRAMFSMYSAWYPGNSFTDLIKELDSKSLLRAPGMVQATRQQGYRTAIFVPENVDNWEHDRTRYEALGFDEIFSTGPSVPVQDTSPTARRERVRAQDLAALALLKQEIIQSTSKNQRYFFSFHPQHGHGPWPTITADSSLADTIAAGRKLFAEQDQWLGQILSVLKQQGRLDKTLIILTGDHGIRTRLEHPTFRGGTIADESFHVPLYLYAPGVLTAPVEIQRVTSHIDLSPSVLDLLGITAGRELELGTFVWNPELENRLTFFFARNYLGADGFQQRGFAYMVKHIINSTFRSHFTGALRFRAADILPGNSSEAVLVLQKIELMTALQNELAKTMMVSAPAQAPTAKALTAKAPLSDLSSKPATVSH